MTDGDRRDGLVVFVEFRVHTGRAREFMDLVRENARLSVSEEPGCRRFDVLVPEEGDPEHVLLYEIYEDGAAFDAHLASRHFRRFAERSATLVAERRVLRLDLFENAKVPTPS